MSGPRRVLIVEDDAETRDLYRIFLEFHGWTVVTASTAGEALQLARSVAPQVILMDVSLPVTDGWTATRWLKQDPETAGIPVIMNTAHARPEDGRESDVSFDGFLTKPCEPRDVLNEILRLAGP